MPATWVGQRTASHQTAWISAAAPSGCPINRLAKSTRFLHTATQGLGEIERTSHMKIIGEVIVPAIEGHSRKFWGPSVPIE